MVDQVFMTQSIGISGAVDYIFSPNSSLIYVSNTNGTISVVDAATRAVTATWTVGTRLGAMTLSDDGQTLLVVERMPASGTAVVYKVQTSTGAVTTYSLPASEGFQDVAITSGNQAILTGSNSDFSSAIVTLDFSTGTFGTIYSFSGADYSLLVESGNLTAITHLFNPPASTAVYGPSGIQATFSTSTQSTGISAISETRGLVVQYLQATFPGDPAPYWLNIFSTTGGLVNSFVLTAPVTGMTFDPSGNSLYIQSAGGMVSRYDTNSWNEVERYTATTSAVGYNGRTGSEMTFSGNGNLLVLADANGTVLDFSSRHLYANGILGTSGADAMAGGVGDDAYIVNHVGDTVTENAYEGNDVVSSTINFTLTNAMSVEVLRALYPGTVTGITLTGNDLNNHIIGDAGNNILSGMSGLDRLEGLGGNDTLLGGDGRDTLIGGDGDDILGGGLGDDLMDGGLGNDTFVIDSVYDVFTDAGGIDTIQTSIHLGNTGTPYYLPSGFENITFTGSLALNAIGTASDNVMIGNLANNTLSGGDGNDTLIGDAGNDTLNGEAGNDILRGGDGVDTLNGGDGDDILDGGTGGDTLNGGLGNDLYILDNPGDVVTDQGGTDTIETGAFIHPMGGPYVLPTGIENLRFTGNFALAGTGNALNNILTGNAGNNTLSGGNGNDTLRGGAGNDVLNGDAGDDILEGEDGNDILNGGDGVDVLSGGNGDDIIYVHPHDVSADGGNDFDTLRFDASEAVSLGGQNYSNFERLDIFTTNAQIMTDLRDFTGYQSTVLQANVFASFSSSSIGAVTLNNARLSLSQNAVAQSVTGSAMSDTVSITSSSQITGAVALGGGDDEFAIWLSPNGVLNLGSTVDGGAGIDTLRVEAVTGTVNTTVDLARFTGFETLATYLHLVPNANEQLTFSHADNFSNIRVGGAGTQTTITATNSTTLMIGATNNGTLTLAAGSSVGSYGMGLTEINPDIANANASATFVNNGTVAGEVHFDGGNDVYNGGNGTSGAVYGHAGNDQLYGGAGNDILHGGDGDDVLAGSLGADILYGGAGNDVLGGGISADSDQMYGGTGDDIFSVDVAGDLVVEYAGEGYDTVNTTMVDTTLMANVEALRLTNTPLGSATSPSAITGRGNALDNAIYGNDNANMLYGEAGDDRIDGGLGADQMYGGDGDDVLVVDNAGDVAEGDEGRDQVHAGVSHVLHATTEDIALSGTANINATGNAYGNIMAGNAGNNIIDGGIGLDYMTGGDGDDIFIVDETDDKVDGEGGRDIVHAYASYALTGSTEDIRLMGSANISAVGNAYGNVMYGNDGNNSLEGGAGVDYMYGGGGDDIMHVDTADDVAEGGDGRDLVFSSSSHVLHATTEDVVLFGTANVSAVGNAYGNVMHGNAGDNHLDGGAGIDYMYGGAGNDVLHIDTTDDVAEGGEGHDLVLASASYALSATTEDGVLIGSANLNMLGNSGANMLQGNSGDNILWALDGNDRLNGGAGTDTLYGGAGNDTFVFTAGAGRDFIGDFENGVDKIDLSAFGLTYADLTYRFQQAGNDAWFQLPTGEIIVINNFQVSQFDASDFIL